MLEFAIAQKEKRLARQQQDWDLLEQVREARAEDMADAPGGASGLLTRKLKSIGFGESSQIVEVLT